MEHQTADKRPGYVYVLSSPNSRYVKIGGTNFPPLKRIKEINSSEPYKSHGAWTLCDCMQVDDWPTVESHLHFKFRSKLNKSIKGQRELFAVSPAEASEHLHAIDVIHIVKKPKVDRLFFEHEFSVFLAKLFRTTTILNWMDFQGAWTLSLFPGTAGGRYYTLNIGTHEVAFSTLPHRNRPTLHMVYMDSLILDFKEVKSWLKKHSGGFNKDDYSTSLDHSISVYFEGDFETAIEFLNLNGVRRAIIAYWTEALVRLQEKSSLSVHSKHHSWNAVAELNRRINGGLL